MGSLSSMKQDYLRFMFRGKTEGERKKIMNQTDKLGVVKLRQMLVTQLRISTTLRNTMLLTFQTDASARPKDVVPLLTNYKGYQSYIAKEYRQYVLPPVSPEPLTSNCQPFDPSRRFIQPGNAQLFTAANFTPESPFNGHFLLSSVGSGKSCMSVMIASAFAGYKIIWVTKTSLKGDILKNHVHEICNKLIRVRYEKIKWEKGVKSADRWLKDVVPQQTSFEATLQMLKQMGMNWTNLSYRQLTNALTINPSTQLMSNAIGRRWVEDAEMASITNEIDPLRKTLLLIDEAHEMFTPEKLGRNEVPDVGLLKQYMQQSYAVSGVSRVRTMFITATPNIDSVLPLMSMVNMLHEHDVFPQMETFDPAHEGDMVDYMAGIRERNNALETMEACRVFPGASALCNTVRPIDEDEEEMQGIEYFNAKGLTGGTVFLPKQLHNSLHDFWTKTYGMISFLNISQDYSLFPHTEFRTVSIPSASRLQEKLIARTLTARGTHPKDIAKKIKHIAAWATFQRSGNASIVPSPIDKEIIEYNSRQMYFEPNYKDLEERIVIQKKQIEDERNSMPKMEDVDQIRKIESTIADLETRVVVATANFVELSNKRDLADSPSGITKAKRALVGASSTLTKLKNNIKRWQTRLQTSVDEVDLFEVRKKLKIRHYDKKINRNERMLKKLSAKEAHRTNNQLRRLLVKDDHEYMDKVLTTAVNEAVEEEDEDEEDESGVVMNNDLYLEEDEIGEEFQGETYEKKTWEETSGRIPKTQDKFPSKHRFDHPATFDKKAFKQDMPLYSPKVQKLIESVLSDDKEDLKLEGKLHKRIIYCEDMHSIRAVAGALMAYGWEFGMKRKYISWKKQFYDAKTGKKVNKTRHSKTQTMTWVPQRVGGPAQDYNRFLILSRGKIGGVSGASINQYAINRISSKGADATYNHNDNAYGQNYRIIIIDRNFIEGVDLPSKYGQLFDADLSRAKQTQFYGRLSRFCGMNNMTFYPKVGWPQVITRFSLKFQNVGIPLTQAQTERLAYNMKAYPKVVPPKYIDSFLDKIQNNVFSPVELQVILDGDMESRKLRKRLLDAYDAMIEKISITATLYAPGMRNMLQFKQDMSNLELEEEETILEYKQNIFTIDQRDIQIIHNTRGMKQVLMEKYAVDEGRIFPLIEGLIALALRRTAKKDMYSWRSTISGSGKTLMPETRKRLLGKIVTIVLADARFADVSEGSVKQIMNDILDDRVEKTIAEHETKIGLKNRVIAQRQQKREHKMKIAIQKKEAKLSKRKLKLDKDKQKHLNQQIQLARVELQLLPGEIYNNPAASERLAAVVHLKTPDETVEHIQAVIVSMYTKPMGTTQTVVKMTLHLVDGIRKNLSILPKELLRDITVKQKLMTRILEVYPDRTEQEILMVVDKLIVQIQKRAYARKK